MHEDSGLDLLTAKERSTLADTPEGGFISHFIEWAGRRTDAPPYSLQSAAFMALSLSCGDTVTLPGIFGSKPTYMNIYVMLVGPSTTMRKTTVLNYVMDVVPKNAQTRENYIVVLDDISGQGFNKAAGASGQTQSPMVFNVDEVAGLFSTIRAKNSYLAGFEAILLKSYDHSPVHILRTGGNIDVPRGAFVNIFAASTPEPLMDVLSGADVESGLLPRFLIFDSSGAKRGKRRTLMERMENSDDWEAEADELRDFLFEVGRGRAMGIPESTDPDGKTQNYPQTRINISLPALKRLDVIDKIFMSEASEDPTGVGAIKGRAFWHMVKLAGLYAVSRDGLEAEVQLIDVIRAVDLVERTVADLIKMQSNVGSNPFERSVIEVKKYIALNPAKRQQQTHIASKFTLSHKDLRDLAGTMVVRGDIHIDTDAKGTTYWRLA